MERYRSYRLPATVAYGLLALILHSGLYIQLVPSFFAALLFNSAAGLKIESNTMQEQRREKAR